MASKLTDLLSIRDDEAEALAARLERGDASPDDLRSAARLLRLLLLIVGKVRSQSLTILRLSRMLFGPSSDTRAEAASPAADAGGEDAAPAPDAAADEEGGGDDEDPPPPDVSGGGDAPPKKRPGHGRRAALAFTGAARVPCQDPARSAGDRCPCCFGRLFDTGAPSIHVRFTGQPIVGATAYEREVLRCSSCLTRFTAPLPEGVPDERYDATADVAIALAKYDAGLPFHRLSAAQAAFGVPLPESVQWERCERLADALLPVYLELRRIAATGEVLYADDTGLKILSAMAENKRLPEKERKGLHTTGIIAEVGDRLVALFASGRKHAGENVGELLALRPEGAPAPIQMGDALAHNWSHGFEAVVAKCLTHARRKFVELEPIFPSECKRVLDDLALVYRIDGETLGLPPDERRAHHRARSGPVMEGLRAWIDRQFEERLVEPNGAVGKAFTYLLNHWEGLTRFLADGFAPLDDNIVERALKRVVLHRKNALFFRTEHGAAVADVVMSVVQSSRLNGKSAWDYLLAIARNRAAAHASPGDWLPWTYEATLAAAAPPEPGRPKAA